MKWWSIPGAYIRFADWPGKKCDLRVWFHDTYKNKHTSVVAVVDLYNFCWIVRGELSAKQNGSLPAVSDNRNKGDKYGLKTKTPFKPGKKSYKFMVWTHQNRATPCNCPSYSMCIPMYAIRIPKLALINRNCVGRSFADHLGMFAANAKGWKIETPAESVAWYRRKNNV